MAALACSSGGTTGVTATFAVEYFTAALTPGAVVPAASGSGAAKTNLETTAAGSATSATGLKFDVSGHGLSSITGVYVYKGAASAAASGTPVLTLCTTTCHSNASSTDSLIVSSTADSTKVAGTTWADLLTQLRSGNAFVQITTAAATGGAVRGQFGVSSTPPDDPFFVLSRQY